MFIAEVIFFGPEKGGRNIIPLSGYHPQVKLDTISTSCVIEGMNGIVQFDFNRTYTVKLRLMFQAEYGHLVQIGSDIDFFEGSKRVGSGVIIRQE